MKCRNTLSNVINIRALLLLLLMYMSSVICMLEIMTDIRGRYILVNLKDTNVFELTNFILMVLLINTIRLTLMLL